MTIKNWKNPGSGRWDEDLLVTVEIASTWLESVSDKQAKVKQGLVNRYSEMRRAGLWDENNDSPIKIDVRGEVIDGKHRLWMVVETGLATRFHVHYNVPTEVYDTTDTGRLRGLDDVAYERFHGNKKAAAISKAMVVSDDGRVDSRAAASLPVMRVFQEQHQDAIAFACSLFRSTMRGVTAPVQAAVARAYYHVPRHELMLFVDRLYSGIVADESEGAVIKLRDWLTLRATSGGLVARTEVYLKTARAIQLFVARRPVASLHAAPKDPFPLPDPDWT